MLMMAAGFSFAVQDEAMPSDLRLAAVHDAACGGSSDPGVPTESTNLGTLPIRAGGRDLGTIVTVHGACHCQGPNCDTLVYLHAGEGYRLALHQKYASLHPMKIVKRGMPSLTGQFEINAAKMETTVYDWDGKDYRPSLCATVIKNKKVPSIERHPCHAPVQIGD
jgi:hypothetical protein